MSDFFDQLEAQLRRSARDRPAEDAGAPRGPRWTRRLGRWLSVAPALAAPAAVVVIALVLLGEHRAPPPRATPPRPAAALPSRSGPPSFPRLTPAQDKVIDDVMRAVATSDRQDEACAPPPLASIRSPGSRPSLSDGTPSSAVLASFRALRRPARLSDALIPREIWDGPGSRPRVYRYGTYPSVSGIYARYVRKVRHRVGADFWIVPAENVNDLRPIPARCYGAQRLALRHELPSIPTRLRATALALQRRYIDYERQLPDPYPGVCLVAVNDTGNGDGADCRSLPEIDAGRGLVSGAPAGVGIVYGMAPDRVHSVSLVFRARRRPPRTVTVPVIDNVFIVRNSHQQLPDDGLPTGLLWRGGGGRVIKVIHLS